MSALGAILDKMNTINVILKATESCNMHCLYCYNQASNNCHSVLSAERLEKFFCLLSSSYDRVNIVWHGGEPLLCGIDYMKKAMSFEENLYQKSGVVFSNSIQTNATLINNKWIDFFRKYRFKIGISFDGLSNSVYRQQTEAVIANIKALQRRKMKFGCLAVVPDDQYDMIGNYIFFRDFGLHFALSPMFSEGCGEQLPKLSAQIYCEKMKKLYDYWLYDTNGVNIRVFTDYISMLYGSRTRTCTNGSCHGKWLGITPDGNLYNCGRDAVRQFGFGNIDEIDTISEAFSSEGFHDLLLGAVARRSKCKESCKLFPYCESGCSDCAIIENGLNNKPSFSCEVFRQIFPYIRDGIQQAIENQTPLSHMNPAVRSAMIKCMT